MSSAAPAVVPRGGPIGTPALAAAVPEAGGLGMIPNPRSVDEVQELVRMSKVHPEHVASLIELIAGV